MIDFFITNLFVDRNINECHNHIFMKGCRFCSLAGTKDNYIIFENNDTIAVLDNKPLSRGHFLVIPKTHRDNLSDMPKAEFLELVGIVNELSLKVCKILNADGVNIAINSGLAAGQQVDHLHVHVIPRYRGDNLLIGAVNRNVENDIKNLLDTYKLVSAFKPSP